MGFGIEETRLTVTWQLLKLGGRYMEFHDASLSTCVHIQNFHHNKLKNKIKNQIWGSGLDHLGLKSQLHHAGCASVCPSVK